VRHSSETWLIAALGMFAVTGVVALQLGEGHDAIGGDPLDPVFVTPLGTAPRDALAWFGDVRQFCNSVEVETRLRLQPAPSTPDGAMHEAACYALAGRIDRARDVIRALPEELRYQAAGVVFEAGHPAADAGDDVAAGPLMELVVEFWPNHYMALYHAGAARYENGDYGPAEDYLTRFMAEYATEDGWRTRARQMLESIERL
jgi:hypothetical protein